MTKIKCKRVKGTPSSIETYVAKPASLEKEIANRDTPTDDTVARD